MIPCGDMHQSLTDTLEKVVFRQLPHVSDSFNVLSVHGTTSGSGASFLYKCPTSRGGSLLQHGLLVSFLAVRTFRTLLLMELSLMSISIGTILLSLYVTEFSKCGFVASYGTWSVSNAEKKIGPFLRAASGSGQIWC